VTSGSRPTLAVVGATGAVGAVLLGLLSERADVWGEIRLVASARSAGRTLTVRGEPTEVRALGASAFDGVDVALFAVPDDVAAHWAPVAAAAGAVVVDDSAAFRGDPDVPLIVPEVNAHAARTRPRGILANPDSTTLTMIVALGALHSEWCLEELHVASYQAVSGSGRSGVETLRAQLAAVTGHPELGSQPGDVRRVAGETGPYQAPIALNVVPFAGALSAEADGWTSQELTLREETRRILALPDLPVTATCVRVPVITGHSLALHACFESKVAVEEAHDILAGAPGVVLCDAPERGEFPTPADVVGTDPTWVGRVRRSPDEPCALALFVCGDNLRKGAALNALHIAETVVSAR
jgi:aspartate-semialdehyde dehydrogenase